MMVKIPIIKHQISNKFKAPISKFQVVWVFISLLILSSLSAADESHLLSGLQKTKETERAPSFLLNDMEGNPKELKDYAGKVILIHFWATWCIPCKDELPTIKSLYERFKDRGFEVIAIAGDSKNAVIPFVAEQGLKFTVLIDQYGSTLRSYKIRGLPTSYLIGKTGKVEGIAIGARDWSSPIITDLIESILKN